MPLSSAIFSLTKKSWKLHNLLPFDRVRTFCHRASTRPRWSFFADADTETESSVYQEALKSQRPTTVVYKTQPVNSVSLIGTVTRELKRINCDAGLGVHTVLKVSAARQSKQSFQVLLKMWHEMAEMSLNHLKPNDFIYVRGHLGSYMKADRNGNPWIHYQVDVKELNYVAKTADDKPVYRKSNKLDLQDDLEREKERLHLWQIFFANPYEWKDYRRSKVNPKHPDFKHMSTGEALWLQHDNPPWVKRQLQLLDSEMPSLRIEKQEMNITSCLPLLS
ncbi:OLC1v1032967C1 [Oldenlandia corymbosa var. corymbosa]|uniref:OLC1v1032967C1 n=1 Tax=Oldenlandia corymbosa var. corymbosa TaxID=529605 RepID=A0AAV1CMW8_OLDCO|nr:OLC1v1032967C1 [Oldenlandia corymbosa var. corymbosa]